MKEIVFSNGKFLAAEDAKIPVSSLGLLMGLGLFETMRSYNKKIVYLDKHLTRIKNSCKLINLKFPYSISKLKNSIKKTVELNAIQDAYVRLTLCKSVSGTDCIILLKKYTPFQLAKYKKGFSAIVSRFLQDENSLLSQIKTTNRMIYEIALQEAKLAGCDEALFLNNKGFIAEASRSNVFLVKNQEIFTPSLQCGCLDGITRRVILDLAKKHHLKASEGNFTLQELYYADEAFLTNSLIGIMPLTCIEKHAIGKAGRGETTEFLIKKYDSLL